MAALQAEDDPTVIKYVEPERCTLLGGTFAIMVQLGLAVSALATLLYKRSTERPRRVWLVWFFDSSKQAFAGVLQHFVNIGFGVLFATTGHASECAWYITNFTISVACGMVILWGIMAGYKRCVDRYRLTLLRSGEYGSPPSWRPWLAQMLVWGFFASFEKVLTAVFVILPAHHQLDKFAQWFESGWLRTHPASELVLVMCFAPVVLNMAFFWAVDNLIMRRRGRVAGEGEDEDDEQADGRQRVPLLDDEGDVGMTTFCSPSAAASAPFTPVRGPTSRTMPAGGAEQAISPLQGSALRLREQPGGAVEANTP